MVWCMLGGYMISAKIMRNQGATLFQGQHDFRCANTESGSVMLSGLYDGNFMDDVSWCYSTCFLGLHESEIMELNDLCYMIYAFNHMHGIG